MALNVGTGVGTSVLEVINLTERISGRPVPHEIVRPSCRRPGGHLRRPDADLPRRSGGRRPRTVDDIIATAWAWHSTHPDGYGSADDGTQPSPS